MGTRPDEIEDQIRKQRQEMSSTLEAIGDRVSPGQAVNRQRRRIRSRVQSWRTRVMGSRDWGEQARRMQQQGGQAVGEAMERTEHGMQQAPHMVERQTRGNPMAAGLVAFGTGLLIGSVIPESRAERDAARRVAPGMPQVADEVRHAGEEVASETGEAAKREAQELRESAGESMRHVTEEARESGQQVADEARHSAQELRHR